MSKAIPAHVSRMIIEKNELKTKVEGLVAFETTQTFLDLPWEDQQLMGIQLAGMVQYFEALCKRLERAGG